MNLKNVPFYLLSLTLVLIGSYAATHFKQYFTGEDDEYMLIKKYLLNDSPLHSSVSHKPILWIHTPYSLNARKWESFGSRTSTNLNEPYLELLIETIIQHCSNDFYICLIDDCSFSKLIPTWDLKLENIADPMRSRIRELGCVELLYLYGGIYVPSSFVCLRNLKDIYGICDNSRPFVLESLNPYARTTSKPFAPTTQMIGAKKGCPVMRELCYTLKNRFVQNSHFENESEFLGATSMWITNAINNGQMILIDGTYIGVKSYRTGKPLLLEDWLEDVSEIDLAPDAVGILIDNDEVLRRNKYNWLATISKEELLAKNNSILVRYIHRALRK